MKFFFRVLGVVAGSFLYGSSSPQYTDSKGSLEGLLALNTGYRQDTFSLEYSFPPQLGNETYRWPLLNIFKIGGEFYLAYQNFYIHGMGDWGKICNGKSNQTHASQTLFNRPPGATTLASTAVKGNKPEGSVYDLSGCIGYQFYLNHGHFMFAPVVGYSLHEQSIKEPHITGTSTELLTTDPTVLIITSDEGSRKIKFRWYGPSLGVDLAYSPNSKLRFFGNYAFTWSKVYSLGKAHIVRTQELPALNPSPTATADVSRKVPNENAIGQDVACGFSYKFSDQRWGNPMLGLTGNYALWNTRKNASVDKIDLLTASELITLTSQGSVKKLWWQSWGITLDIGCAF